MSNSAHFPHEKEAEPHGADQVRGGARVQRRHLLHPLTSFIIAPDSQDIYRTCIYVYICTVHMYVCIHTYIHICHIHLHTCTCTCICIYIYPYIHILTYIYIQIVYIVRVVFGLNPLYCHLKRHESFPWLIPANHKGATKRSRPHGSFRSTITSTNFQFSPFFKKKHIIRLLFDSFFNLFFACGLD